jgi:DNA-binding Lrp family transcriptional regulator
LQQVARHRRGSPRECRRALAAIAADGYGPEAGCGDRRSTACVGRIAINSQSDDALKSFETAVVNCPSVIRTFLMSGNDDYLLIVLARDIEGFERTQAVLVALNAGGFDSREL